VREFMSRKLLTRVIAAALLAALLAACGKAVPPPPLVVGANAWIGCEPVFLARELGYLPPGRIRLNEYAAPAEVAQAFGSGAVQLAIMPLEQALLLRRDVPDLKIIMLADLRTTEKTLDVMVVRDESIGKFHGELTTLLQGWQRALDYERAEPTRAATGMAQREHLDAAQLARQMQSIERYDLRRNRELMAGEQPAIAASIDAMQRAMMSRGALQVGAEAVTLLDTTLLSEKADKNGAAQSGVAAP
jgi:ABC-type nitrate/sulfonate/bicarbonate transport system substrate-binding protein